MEEILNEKIIHIKFGVGFIVSIVGNEKIIGEFDELVENKKFEYPDAFKEAEFDIMFGKGISKEGDIVDLAVKIDVVNKSGSWYIYNDERIGQGRENVKAYFTEHRNVMEEVELKVRQYYNLNEEKESEYIEKSKIPSDMN